MSRRSPFLLAALVCCTVGLAAQNGYVFQWDRNTDTTQGYEISDTGVKVGEVAQPLDATAVPWWPFTLPVDDYSTHVYGVTAFVRQPDGTIVKSLPATKEFAQVPTPVPTPTPTPVPEPTPNPTPTPTPIPPPTGTPSADCSEATEGIVLTDGLLHQFVIDFGWILRDGTYALQPGSLGGAHGSLIKLISGVIHVLDDRDVIWYRWDETARTMVRLTATKPACPEVGPIPTPVPTPTPTPTPVPAPPPPPSWTCTIPQVVKSYANGDKQVALRCPPSFPGKRGQNITVTVQP